MDGIREFMSIYLRCWEERKGFVLERLFKEGAQYFQNLPQSKKALALTVVFDDTKGILAFLRTEVDEPNVSKDFQATFNVVFHFIQFFITEFQDVCEPYVIKIKKCCVFITTLKTAPYLHKVSCMTLILLIENFPHVDLQLDDIIRSWMKKIHFFKETELNPILRVLSVVARYHPDTAVIVENAGLIQSCAIKLFDKMFHNIARNKPHVLQMTIESLVDILYNFPLRENDPKLLKFYENIKKVILVSVEGKKHDIIKAILKYITQQMKTSKGLILSDYEYWLRFFLQCHKEEVYHDLSATALSVYYEVMGKALSETVLENRSPLNSLKAMFLRNLADDTLSKKDLRLSVGGYTNLVDSLKKIHGDAAVEEMYSIIASRILPLYFSENEASEYFDDIADYQESLSRILLHMSNVSNDQIKTLVKLCILLIKRYPDLPLARQSSAVDSLKKTFSNIGQLKVHIFHEFVKNVTFEGVIWSCSHSLLIDAEFQRDLENLEKRPISYKNYVSLWKGLLDPQGYEKISILQQIVNELIETCIKLVVTLNLTIRSRDDNVCSDLALSKVAENEADFRIFLNIVDLYNEIFSEFVPIYLMDKLPKFIYGIIRASYRYPLLSGFYRLVDRALNVEDYFDAETKVNKELFKMILQYLQNTLSSVCQYPHELQVACIQLLLHIPMIFVQYLIDHLVSIFKIALKIGLNDYDVAGSALSALENYSSALESKLMNEFIKELMPHMELYLRSNESFQIYDISTEPDVKSIKSAEEGLEKIQKRILLLFGKFELSVVLEFLHEQSLSTGATWDKKDLLEYSLNFSDMSLEVQLDTMLPRIIDLALNSGDRRTRVAASEVLHSVVAMLLGKTARCLAYDPDRYAPMYKRLCPVLLQLGSDTDEVIRQLYNPLTLQLTHWLSSKLMLHSPAVIFLVDALFDGLSDETNFSLRDFSGICLAEFTKWSIKQSGHDDLTRSPININTIVENIANYALHPSNSRRIAAAIAFNYLHTILSDSNEIVNIFWLELLYVFVKSMHGCNDSNIAASLNHIQKILIRKAKMFNSTNRRRKIPIEFNGGTLADTVHWLLMQCSSLDVNVRMKCMNLVEHLAISIDNYKSATNFIANYLEVNGIDELNQIILKDTDDTTRRIAQNSEQSVNYLLNLLRSLDCYVWLIEKKLINSDALFSDSNIRREIIFTCIKNFTLAVLNLEHNTNITDTKNVALIITLLCKVILSLYDFILTILRNEIAEKDWVHAELFNKNLFILLSRCILKPAHVGFDTKNLLITESLPIYLEKLVKILYEKLPPLKIEEIQSNFNNEIIHSADKIFDIEDDFNEDYGKNLNIVKGLILLNKCGVLEKLQVWNKIVSDSHITLLKIFSSLKIGEEADIFADLSSEKKIYFENLLKLLLECQPHAAKTVIEIILKGITPSDTTQTDYQISHGEHFFNTFKEVIVSCLLTDVSETLQQFCGFLPSFPNIILFMSEEIVNWVLKYKVDYADITEILANDFIKQFNLFKRSINNIEGRKKSFTNIYRAVVRLKDDPLDVLHHRGELYTWILDEFTSTDDLGKKTRVLDDFLICLTSEDYTTPEIKVILSGLKQVRGNQSCEVLQGNTLKISKINECFQALLTLLPITKSPDVFYATINFTMGIGQSVFNDAAYGHLNQYIKNLSESNALKSLEIAYKLFMDTPIVNERLDIIKYFLFPALENCRTHVIEQFFEENIKEIFTVIVTDLPRSITDSKRLIVSKICCFNLIEFMFNHIELDKINDNEEFVAKNILEPNASISVTQRIFKCTLQVRSLKTEVLVHEEIMRLLHCAAYNCCITIASTTKDNRYYLSLFAENRKTGQLIWEHIVDCKKTYELSQTFREYPKQRKKLLNIRNTMKQRQSGDPGLYSYTKSYNLESSTLNENIYAYDFSEVILTSRPSDDSLAITLEVDDLNNHECMYTICGILKLMADNEISISGDGKNPPKGLQCFAGSIGSVHYNAKLFMLKIILNNQAIFKPYAELFLAPVLIILISMLTEGKLNYIITDALLMLVDWSEVAVPDDKTSHQANELFSLLVQQVDDVTPTEYVIRYNFRIVELLVQVWHYCLEIPPGLSERIHNTKQVRFRAVRLILIYLANKMADKIINQPHILEFLIEFLKENWDYKEEYVLQTCEAISLFLKFSNTDEDDAVNEECADKIRHVLRQLQIKNPDRLVKCIHAMSKAYAPLSEYFFEFIMGNYQKVGPLHIAKCIEVLLIRMPRMTVTDIWREMSYMKFHELLNNKVISCEKVCLEVIKKLVDILEVGKLLSLANQASAYSTHDSPEYRRLTYEIFMSIYQKYSNDITDSYEVPALVDMSKKVLLPGLLDPFEELQTQLTTFWTEEIGLQNTCTGRIIDILDVYSANAEKKFLPIFIIILLHLVKKSPNYNSKLYEPLNASCDYRNYQIVISWRMKNLSYRIPLFTSSYASQYTQRFGLSSFAGDEMISSYNNLMLQATFMADLDKSATNEISSTLGPSATLKETDIFIAPEAPSRNILSKRFLENPSVASATLNRKLENYHNKEDLLRQQLAKQRNSVKLNRMYRIGDFPDVEITHESILPPLQELVKKDQLICKDFVVSIICSLLSKIGRKSKNGDDNSYDFLSTLERKFNYILENRRENGLIMATILEIMFNSDDLAFDPEIVAHVSQAAGFNYHGALLLERNLLTDVTTVASPPAKRSRTESSASRSVETNQWIQLGELYESINEVDIVLSIFQNHVTEIDELREAALARSNGKWDTAYRYYGRICNSEIETVKRHSRQAMFECLARLCDWDKIIETVEKNMNMENRLDYVLEMSKSDDEEWMALWYFKSLIYKVLTWRALSADAPEDEKERNQHEEVMLNEFMRDLVVSMKIPSKAEVLKDLFAEEMSGICTHDLQAESRDFISSALDKVRGQWNQLNPLSAALRAHEVIKLRGIFNVDIYRHIIEDPSKTQSILINYWVASIPYPRDDLLPWDKHIAYRTNFIEDFRRFIDNQNSQNDYANVDIITPIIKVKLQMIDAAFEQQNKSLMKNYLQSVFNHIVEDDNELHNQFKLNRVRFRLLRAKVGDAAVQINQYPQSWKEAEEILRNDNIDMSTRISTRHFIVDLATIIIDLNNRAPELYRPIFNSIEQYILPYMQNASEEIEGLRACCFNNLKTCCIDAVRHSVDVSKMSDCHERLMKYCHDKILINEANRDLIKEFVKSTLRAMRYGSRLAANYFPCLLNAKYLEDAEIRDIFKNECAEIPTWRFIKWHAQILVHLPTSLENLLAPIVERLMQAYPNALMYSLRLTIENHAEFRGHPIVRKYAQNILYRHQVINFIEAVEYLVRPELYLSYHLDKLLDNPKFGNPDLIDQLLQKVYPEAKIPALQGNIYKYIAKYREEILKMKNMSTEEIKNQIVQIKKALEVSLIKYKDSEYLKDYSPWLSKFNGSNIEIPGQYTHNHEPWPDHHVKLMKIESKIQVMKSVRKPIKITIIGNDAKNYNFLVKFGEDLRLDERVEQAFGIMNEILQSDISSSRRHLAMNTYQVTTFSGSLGLIQWLDNTKNLNDYINFNLSNAQKDRWTGIRIEYKKWIRSANSNAKLSLQYKEALIKYDVKTVNDKMNELTGKMDWDLLRQTFLMLSPSLESFMSTRRNFVITYGTMCIGQWILGIGDRHLENTLISIESGKATGIDFASAFGGGVDQPVPELVPFRLTNQIKGLMKPFDENDEFKAAMIHVLRALRSGKGPLLAYLGVVANENLNWTEYAQHLSAEVQEKNRNISWLAANKFEYVSMKLNGKKPSETMLHELKDHHYDGKYYPRYTEIVNGIEDTSGSYRAKMKEDDLTAEEQVCCLLEQATDLNILGRMYVGWNPWI